MRHFKINMRHKCDTQKFKVAHLVAHRKWLIGSNQSHGPAITLAMRSLGGALLHIRGRWIDRSESIICAAPGMHSRCK
jgi:hypothetical protein